MIPPVARRLLWIACCLFACGIRVHAQSRVAFAEYEIAGPCERIVLDAGLAGSTHVEGVLSAGESRRVVLPIPTSPGAPPLEPRVETSSGTAHFLGWLERDARLSQIPAALRARPVPLASAARVRVGVAVLCLLAVAGIAGLWCARWPFASLGLALVAATAIFVLARASLERDAAPVEVLDGIAGSGAWQRARAARDTLALPGRGPNFDLAVEPSRAPIRIEVPLDLARPTHASSKGAQLVAVWPEPWPAEALDRAANDLAPLSAVWVREAGDWTYRAAWPLRAPLGDAAPRPPAPGSDPPGWLVAGLPQGVTLLVGEVAGSPRSFVRCTYP
ncbi:MAG: hypothetical protein NTY35_12495 [Planctomycetota bacterium]|nr:hypothetical protein [Planctomycetota bacterium]